MQRRVLTDILDRVPTYYNAAHGFVKGRSPTTFALPHVGQRILLRIDLQEFFPTISGARVQALFRTMGFPESVADVLGGICTNATPQHVWTAQSSPSNLRLMHDIRRTYARPHLPQGAPTSPALANLCAYRLDCRLTGLADWAGAVYSRYADDLAFSGGAEFARAVERYAAQIGAIALEEGWSVNHRKTRIMGRATPRDTRVNQLDVTACNDSCLAYHASSERPLSKRASHPASPARRRTCRADCPSFVPPQRHSNHRRDSSAASRHIPAERRE